MTRVSALECSASMLKQCAEISVSCLTTVRKLRVYSRPGDGNRFESDWFQMLLRVLPQLSKIDMSDFVPSNAHAVLVHRLLEEHLHLSSCDGIAALIVALGPTMTAVSFGGERNIDTPTLNLIFATCNKVKELIITCQLNSSQDYAACFGSTCLPLLERIDLDCNGPKLDEAAVSDFFQHHPLLTIPCTIPCVAFRQSPISPVTCASFVASCPKIVRFYCSGFAFNVCGSQNLRLHSEEGQQTNV